MASRHHADAESLVPRETDGGYDVGRSLDHNHHGRPLVRIEVPRRARLVVALLMRTQQCTP